ncbi:toxin-activating lysine-acyltransferase [Rhodovulum sp. DZ06]|uniref:toxin-activating lysine-acyltransferase n=1 Tax=Rhodovulum sp. DZ06 TaxID=3425126 RepID=UPI003D35502B
MPSPRTEAERLTWLGAAMYLLMQSDLHRPLRLADAEALFVVPATLGQARLYAVGPRPVGLVTWAWFTEGAEAAHLEGERAVAPEEWQGGDRLWFPDFVAPFGHLASIVRASRDVIPRGAVGRGARRAPDGSVRRIQVFRPLAGA